MSEVTNGQSVDLSQFADMAGFPVELVKKELMVGTDGSETVSMDELRAAMLKYLDSTMLE